MEVNPSDNESAVRQRCKSKHREQVTYTCQKCSKVDLQVSMCLKVIHDYMLKYEGGFTDSLDDMDPIVKRLFLDRGYEERRRKPKKSASSPKRHQSKPKTMTDAEANFSVMEY